MPKSTTLDDLEQPIRILLQKSCVFRSPPQKKLNEDRPILSAAKIIEKCRPLLTLVSGDIKSADIRKGSLERGRQTTGGGGG